MTITRPTVAPLPGCTCIHAPGLHGPDRGPGGPGCRVGWTGAGEPAPGTDTRHWPTGCPCTAAPAGSAQ